MKREQFDHVLRAAAAVVRDEIVVVGSQAVHGTVDDPPAALVTSLEVDVYPLHDPARAADIDGALGDGSPFHRTYGYYAHGVGPETIVAPAGWEQRLVRRTLPAVRRRDGAVTGWCLSLEDLMLAKLAAGRPHDLVFVEAALRGCVVDGEQLRLGIDLLPARHRDGVRMRLEGLVAKIARFSG